MPEPQEEDVAAPAAAEPTRRTKLLADVTQQVKVGRLVLGATVAVFLAGAAVFSYFGTLAKAGELQATVRRVDRLEEARSADRDTVSALRIEMHRIGDQVNAISRALFVPIVNQSMNIEQAAPTPKK